MNEATNAATPDENQINKYINKNMNHIHEKNEPLLFVVVPVGVVPYKGIAEY
jgi:hypothetical protein